MGDSYEEPGAGDSYEELGFGDDRPARRSWLLVHGKPLAIIAGVVVLLAVMGFAGWRGYQRSLLPAPPPDAAFAPATGFEVALCQGCEPERFAVERVLAGLPEVTSYTYVSPEQTLARVRGLVVDERRMPQDNLGAGAIEGQLREPGDFEALRAKLAGLPGVEHVLRSAPSFWSGRAHVGVVLCGVGWQGSLCLAKATTAERRNALVAALRDLDAVEEVYLQDQEFGRRLSEHYQGEDASYHGPEILYVKVNDPTKAKAAGQAVMNLQGVAGVFLVAP